MNVPPSYFDGGKFSRADESAHGFGMDFEKGGRFPDVVGFLCSHCLLLLQKKRPSESFSDGLDGFFYFPPVGFAQVAEDGITFFDGQPFAVLKPHAFDQRS